LGLFKPSAPGKHHVIAVLVQLNDLGFQLPAHVGLEVADAAHLDQRGGQEATQPDVEDQTTLDHLDDGAAHRLLVLLEGLDIPPGALILGAFLRQDQPAFLVLLLENEGLDLVAHRHDIRRVDVVFDGQFPGRDDALGLVTNVKQHFVTVNFDDGALDDIAIVEVLDRLVDGGEKVLLRPDIVDRNLLWGRGGGGVGGHAVGCSEGIGSSGRCLSQLLWRCADSPLRQISHTRQTNLTRPINLTRRITLAAARA
jgi:hypothetical protein